MQIVFFILILAFVLFVIAVTMIGSGVMKFLLWCKGLFCRKQTNVSGDSRTYSNSQTSNVIKDDEGEYIDFEEVKE